MWPIYFVHLLVRAPSPPPPPMPDVPVAPLKSWQPVSAEPREKFVPVEEPVTRKPWEPILEQRQEPVQAPQRMWEPPMSELRARMEAPQRQPQEFVVTRAEKILESNLQYRRSKEPEEKKQEPIQVKLCRFGRNFIGDRIQKFTLGPAVSHSTLC